MLASAVSKVMEKEGKKSSSKKSSSKEKKKKKEKSSSSKSVKEPVAVPDEVVEVAGESPAGSSTRSNRFFYGELFARHSSGLGTLDRDAFLTCLDELARGPARSGNPAEVTPPSFSNEEEFVAGQVFARHAAQSGALTADGFLAALEDIKSQGGSENAPGVRAVLVPDEKTPTGAAEQPYFAAYPGVHIPSRVSGEAALRGPYGTMDPHLNAVRDDYTRLHGALQAILGPRRDDEVHKLNHIDAIAEEVRAVVRDIETDTRTDADAIIGRVRTHGENKIRTLHQIRARILDTLRGLDHFHMLAMGPRPLDALRHEHIAPATATMKVLASAQSAINGRTRAPYMPPAPAAPSAVGTISQPEPRPEAMVQFIRNYGEIEASLQRLVAKQGPDDTEALRAAMQDDYPREVADRRAKSAKLDAAEHSVKAKDVMIANLMKEMKDYERQKAATMSEVDELTRASSVEINEWVKLSDKIAQDMGDKLKVAHVENRRLKNANEHLEAQIDVLMRENARLRAMCPPRRLIGLRTK